MKQRDIFLDGEGDRWYARNRAAIDRREFGPQDKVISAIQRCVMNDQAALSGAALLEIGCGEGKRLRWIKSNLALECFGIDPSMRAIESALIGGGLSACHGTAERLPFSDHAFSFVVFGFCLYLCDREDLFRIAMEADRVLKPGGWLIIQDFFATAPSRRAYHHKAGVFSFKMDYRRLFDWHPAYLCYSHELNGHTEEGFTDDPEEWVATSVLRKHLLR